MNESVVDLNAEATVADLSVPRQKEFREWLKSKGLKNSYVSRILSVGRAAIQMAWKQGEITSTRLVLDEPDRSFRQIIFLWGGKRLTPISQI